ncbi:putative bifunctional diguanylate cyclase/phosphodiesterase [Marinobacter sp.]|uniref:putative bifunctional diguanylate cyclase/phosphodiesterase n=1 Tax=Marinobacter sp. TaxID=50741 RepID=UPI0035C766E2
MKLGKDDPLSAVLRAAADAVVLIDKSGIIQQVSQSMQRIFGYAPSDCVGNNVSMLMPEPDRSAPDRHINSYLHTGNAKIIGFGRRTTGCKKTGETFPMHLSVGEFQVDGESYFVGICHDLTDHFHALADLERAEKRYKDIIESQKYFICRLDEQLRLTFANASLATILGKSYDELIGVHLAHFLAEGSVDSTKELHNALSSHRDDEINLKFEMRTRRQPTHAEWSFRRVSNNVTGELELQGLGVDVSDREHALLRAEFLRDHDQLTGLLRVPALLDHLRATAKPSERYAFLCVDPDRLTQVNQRYGYDVGNRVIVEIARRMNSLLPEAGLIGRLGGDELIMVFEASGRDGTVGLANAVLNKLKKPYTINDEQYRLDFKAGIALFPDDNSDLGRLPDLAEAAMREAKSKNLSLALFTDVTHQRLLRTIALEQALKNALAAGSIDVYLQPKIDLATKSKCGYEALARWHHCEWGVVSPGEFMPVVEAGGLGPEFDRYILRKVVDIACSMRSSGEEPLPIAVNITGNHFADSTFYDNIVHKLSKYSLPPSALELEITEGMVLEMTADVASNLSRLKKLGIKVSLDDFGTGYSSLSYLKKLDVDELKIDKSFIDDLIDPKGELVVKSMIGLAKAYGMSVTAEGVETEWQAERLVRLGCDLAQGYLFSPALTERGAREWTP